MIAGAAHRCRARRAHRRLPPALDLYCRRVAGSVGAMAVRIFGAPDAVDFDITLGRTLQLVNILRDIDEDATRDRVYLPLDLLARHGHRRWPGRYCMMAAAGIAEAAAAVAAQAAAGVDIRPGGAAAARRPGAPARAHHDVGLSAAVLLHRRARLRAAAARRPLLTTTEKARMAAFALRLAPVAAR